MIMIVNVVKLSINSVNEYSLTRDEDDDETTLA